MIDYNESLFEIADKYDLLLEECEKYEREYESRDERYYYGEDEDYEEDRQTPEEYREELFGDLKRGEEFVLVRYLGRDEEVFIPDGIRSIKSSAFAKNKTLRKVYVPDSVRRIADFAFGECTSLEEIRLSEKLEGLGASVFKGCRSLKYINIPNSVQIVGDETFSGCASLTEVRLSENLKAISAETFKGCSSLRGIRIPDEVKTVRIHAFDGCASLENVQFGEKSHIESIGWDAFARCRALKRVKLPDGLKSLSQSVFYDGGLEEIYIPQSVEFISPSAFSSCCNLKKVEIAPNNMHYYSHDNCIYDATDNQILVGRNDGRVPNDGSLKFIGDNSFECNPFVKEFNVPYGVTSIGIGAFRNCENLRCVTLPTTLESIGRCAFEGTGLESITVPSKVKIIEENSFACSKLQRVILKRGVETLETYAFRKCQELQEVYIPSSVKKLYSFCTFGDCKQSMRIYLEKGARGEYIRELQEKFDVVTDCESDIFD